MDIGNNKDLSNFTNILSLWKNIYKYVVVSYLELKTNQGPRLFCGRVIFTDIRPKIGNFDFNAEHISAGRYIAKTNKATIDNYLLKAAIGELACSDRDKKLILEKDNHISTYFIPPLSSIEMKLPIIKFAGISRYNLISKTAEPRKLDSELKSAQQPFDTLDELLVYCGLPSLNQIGDNTAIEIIAVNPAFIRNDSKINNNKAIIKCIAAKDIDKTKLRLGFRIFKKSQIERGSETGTAFTWRKEKQSILGTLKMPIKNSALLQTYLSYKGVCIDQWWITDASKLLNPRQSIHETMEKNLESLKNDLIEIDIKNASNFESAVTTLLHLLGFSVVNYGKTRKLLDGPDIIAITPQGNIAVVECTVGLLNNKDKLAKLVQRTNVIKTRMGKTGFGHLAIQPVIVTALSREEVKVDLEFAAKHDIAVISRENIDELLRRVSMPLDSEKLFKEAKMLIPITDKPPLPRFVHPVIKSK
jgi:hypothetical protein